MKRIWNKMSITKKLLIITLSVFLTFCAFEFFGQMIFFENYYTYVKSKEVKNAVLQFSAEYKDYNDKDTLRANMSKLSEDNDCYMMVMDENSGAVKHMMSYEMTIETIDGKSFCFSLDNAINKKVFSDMELTIGDEAEVYFFGNKDGFLSHIYFPVQIRANGKEWEISKPNNRTPPSQQVNDKQAKESVDNVSGVITGLILPSEYTRNINSEREVAAKAALDWVENGHTAEMKGIYSYYYTDPETSEKFAVVVKRVSNAANDVIFAIAPLNMVSEAADAASHMYSIFFVLSIFAASTLGIIFARAVTRPIIKMTSVTKSMAELDFTQKCNYKSNDEIGELSDNINILSSALDSAVQELQSANEKLKEDIERKQTEEKIRREFVAAASHELKTPLGIIRAYTEALIDDISVNKRQHYSEVIINETEKMDKLIIDMLDNTKYESGAEKPNLSECNLSAVALGVINRFSEPFNKKSITLVNNIENNIVCSADSEMIERVITNFAANSAAHTPENGVVTVSVFRKDAAAVFTIENTSAHIPDDEIAHIWDKFYKADKSRNRTDGGTGLGLSIAKNILNLHNAEYGAENTDDGVRFFFEISDNI